MEMLLLIAALATETVNNVRSYNLYENPAIVCEIEGDDVLCEDSAGNLWAFFGDGVANGDEISLTMCDMGTEIVFDDWIVNYEVKEK